VPWFARLLNPGAHSASADEYEYREAGQLQRPPDAQDSERSSVR
jgi:hypothetical protein